jgi:O-antigen/teichoic acid export membrane protein
MAVGSAVTGVLAYVFFALVTRALGAREAAGVSVLWTWWSFAAAGLTFPLQHWIVRSVAAAGGREGGVRAALPKVVGSVGALAVLTAAVGWLLREQLFHDDGAGFPVLVGVVTLGSAFIGVVRGLLTARGRLVAVGWALVAENGLRCLLAVALLLAGAEDALGYAVALAAGQLVGLIWPRAAVPRGPAHPEAWLSFLGGAAGGQLIGQAVLTGGPVALALLGGRAAEVTALFAALALFRLPYTLALGAVPPLTGAFTRMGAQGRIDRLRRTFGGIVAGTLVAGSLAAVVAALLGPWLLRLVFGSTVRLAGDICALVAVGSTFALGCLLLSLLAMAAERSGLMLRGWGLGAATAAILLAVGPGTPLTSVAVAFLAAEAVAAVVLALTVGRTLTRPADTGLGETTRTS